MGMLNKIEAGKCSTSWHFTATDVALCITKNVSEGLELTDLSNYVRAN